MWLTEGMEQGGWKGQHGYAHVCKQETIVSIYSVFDIVFADEPTA